MKPSSAVINPKPSTSWRRPMLINIPSALNKIPQLVDYGWLHRLMDQLACSQGSCGMYCNKACSLSWPIVRCIAMQSILSQICGT